LDKPQNESDTESTKPEGGSNGSVLTISWLSPKDVEDCGGFPGPAICGVFEEGVESPDHFRPNAAFEAVMHDVIGSMSPQDPMVQMVAQDVQHGWMPIVDLRARLEPGKTLPDHDILGAFEVENGRVKPGSYRVNENHRVYAEEGLVRLTPFLSAALTKRLVSLAKSYEGETNEDVPPN
jgi:hypothetical protein